MNYDNVMGIEFLCVAFLIVNMQSYGTTTTSTKGEQRTYFCSADNDEMSYNTRLYNLKLTYPRSFVQHYHFSSAHVSGSIGSASAISSCSNKFAAIHLLHRFALCPPFPINNLLHATDFYGLVSPVPMFPLINMRGVLI